MRPLNFSLSVVRTKKISNPLSISPLFTHVSYCANYGILLRCPSVEMKPASATATSAWEINMNINLAIIPKKVVYPAIFLQKYWKPTKSETS
jgi:hypothetical protein